MSVPWLPYALETNNSLTKSLTQSSGDVLSSLRRSGGKRLNTGARVFCGKRLNKADARADLPENSQAFRVLAPVKHPSVNLRLQATRQGQIGNCPPLPNPLLHSVYGFRSPARFAVIPGATQT